MSKSKTKILFKLTGSIAAYKSAYLISKLVQNGFEVQTVASEAALRFIGRATLEGLTSKPVMTDSFEDGKMMSHINLVKWADITIVCPASANTLNKLANGVGDNLIASLFLAHDWNKPYIIAPAMNTAMFNHPATQESFGKLEKWGVKILPTDDGHLACGDYGKGKLLDPDKIYDYIQSTVNASETKTKLNILITAGGTRENIDGIRYITNLSTGKTASALAQHFIYAGHNVTYLHAKDSLKPEGIFKEDIFEDYKSLQDKLNNLISDNEYDVIIHNAAVSDYTPYKIEAGSENIDLPAERKIPSSAEELLIKLKPNSKLVNSIKENSKNNKVKVVAFKFTNGDHIENRISKANELLAHSQSDFIVINDLSDRLNGVQKSFTIISKDGKSINAETNKDLAKELEKLLAVTIGRER
jgi:phosphopantothenoylcysteine decarboxylase/phosphopantothenate--cysteine ligase